MLIRRKFDKRVFLAFSLIFVASPVAVVIQCPELKADFKLETVVFKS